MPAVQKWAMVPRAAEKADRKAKAERTQRTVYRHVEARDEMRCRACGRRVVKTISMEPNQLHHHHHPFRSQGGGSRTADVVLLCREHHDQIHMRTLMIEGQSCDRLLTFTSGSKRWTS